MGWINYIISLIFTGLIVGALGRLVVPGRNPMSILATIAVGIVGALIGGLIAGLFGAGWLITIILEVALAALLVYFLSGRTRASL
ncbi:MAG TPA: GlsB/YeaQ/YmgE family stress response membrane protein [Actinomycetes bacterium]|jgi:uncharacterized membrane protein YeaQ/YmgE (transglycosylase-associated protein family)|nr:GlsB/YeaQ/YmgE family stress response membrane protein [Actinomycetes bacterium]